MTEQGEAKRVFGYIGWALPDDERATLLDIFEPTHPDVIAHHVTETYGVWDDHELPTATAAEIIGIADDGLVQALLVSIEGTIWRKDGEIYHITWSLDRANGARPKHAKETVRKPISVEPISITLIPRFFPA